MYCRTCRRPPKVIIYSNFQTAFKRIKLFLDTKEIRYASLVDSGMSMKKRAEAMENFKENDEVPVFLLVSFNCCMKRIISIQCSSIGMYYGVCAHVLCCAEQVPRSNRN